MSVGGTGETGGTEANGEEDHLHFGVVNDHDPLFYPEGRRRGKREAVRRDDPESGSTADIQPELFPLEPGNTSSSSSSARLRSRTTSETETECEDEPAWFEKGNKQVKITSGRDTGRGSRDIKGGDFSRTASSRCGCLKRFWPVRQCRRITRRTARCTARRLREWRLFHRWPIISRSHVAGTNECTLENKKQETQSDVAPHRKSSRLPAVVAVALVAFWFVIYVSRRHSESSGTNEDRHKFDSTLFSGTTREPRSFSSLELGPGAPRSKINMNAENAFGAQFLSDAGGDDTAATNANEAGTTRKKKKIGGAIPSGATPRVTAGSSLLEVQWGLFSAVFGESETTTTTQAPTLAEKHLGAHPQPDEGSVENALLSPFLPPVEEDAEGKGKEPAGAFFFATNEMFEAVYDQPFPKGGAVDAPPKCDHKVYMPVYVPRRPKEVDGTHGRRESVIYPGWNPRGVDKNTQQWRRNQIDLIPPAILEGVVLRDWEKEKCMCLEIKRDEKTFEIEKREVKIESDVECVKQCLLLPEHYDYKGVRYGDKYPVGGSSTGKFDGGKWFMFPAIALLWDHDKPHFRLVPETVFPAKEGVTDRDDYKKADFEKNNKWIPDHDFAAGGVSGPNANFIRGLSPDQPPSSLIQKLCALYAQAPKEEEKNSKAASFVEMNTRGDDGGDEDKWLAGASCNEELKRDLTVQNGAYGGGTVLQLRPEAAAPFVGIKERPDLRDPRYLYPQPIVALDLKRLKDVTSTCKTTLTEKLGVDLERLGKVDEKEIRALRLDVHAGPQRPLAVEGVEGRKLDKINYGGAGFSAARTFGKSVAGVSGLAIAGAAAGVIAPALGGVTAVPVVGAAVGTSLGILSGIGGAISTAGTVMGSMAALAGPAAPALALCANPVGAVVCLGTAVGVAVGTVVAGAYVTSSAMSGNNFFPHTVKRWMDLDARRPEHFLSPGEYEQAWSPARLWTPPGCDSYVKTPFATYATNQERSTKPARAALKRITAKQSAMPRVMMTDEEREKFDAQDLMWRRQALAAARGDTTAIGYLKSVYNGLAERFSDLGGGDGGAALEDCVDQGAIQVLIPQQGVCAVPYSATEDVYFTPYDEPAWIYSGFKDEKDWIGGVSTKSQRIVHRSTLLNTPVVAESLLQRSWEISKAKHPPLLLETRPQGVLVLSQVNADDIPDEIWAHVRFTDLGSESLDAEAPILTLRRAQWADDNCKGRAAENKRLLAESKKKRYTLLHLDIFGKNPNFFVSTMSPSDLVPFKPDQNPDLVAYLDTLGVRKSVEKKLQQTRPVKVEGMRGSHMVAVKEDLGRKVAAAEQAAGDASAKVKEFFEALAEKNEESWHIARVSAEELVDQLDEYTGLVNMERDYTEVSALCYMIIPAIDALQEDFDAELSEPTAAKVGQLVEITKQLHAAYTKRANAEAASFLELQNDDAAGSFLEMKELELDVDDATSTATKAGEASEARLGSSTFVVPPEGRDKAETAAEIKGTRGDNTLQEGTAFLEDQYGSTAGQRARTNAQQGGSQTDTAVLDGRFAPAESDVLLVPPESFLEAGPPPGGESDAAGKGMKGKGDMNKGKPDAPKSMSKGKDAKKGKGKGPQGPPTGKLSDEEKEMMTAKMKAMGKSEGEISEILEMQEKKKREELRMYEDEDLDVEEKITHMQKSDLATSMSAKLSAQAKQVQAKAKQALQKAEAEKAQAKPGAAGESFEDMEVVHIAEYKERVYFEINNELRVKPVRQNPLFYRVNGVGPVFYIEGDYNDAELPGRFVLQEGVTHKKKYRPVSPLERAYGLEGPDMNPFNERGSYEHAVPREPCSESSQMFMLSLDFLTKNYTDVLTDGREWTKKIEVYGDALYAIFFRVGLNPVRGMPEDCVLNENIMFKRQDAADVVALCIPVGSYGGVSLDLITGEDEYVANFQLVPQESFEQYTLRTWKEVKKQHGDEEVALRGTAAKLDDLRRILCSLLVRPDAGYEPYNGYPRVGGAEPYRQPELPVCPPDVDGVLTQLLENGLVMVADSKVSGHLFAHKPVMAVDLWSTEFCPLNQMIFLRMMLSAAVEYRGTGQVKIGYKEPDPHPFEFSSTQLRKYFRAITIDTVYDRENEVELDLDLCLNTEEMLRRIGERVAVQKLPKGREILFSEAGITYFLDVPDILQPNVTAILKEKQPKDGAPLPADAQEDILNLVGDATGTVEFAPERLQFRLLTAEEFHKFEELPLPYGLGQGSVGFWPPGPGGQDLSNRWKMQPLTSFLAGTKHELASTLGELMPRSAEGSPFGEVFKNSPLLDCKNQCVERAVIKILNPPRSGVCMDCSLGEHDCAAANPSYAFGQDRYTLLQPKIAQMLESYWSQQFLQDCWHTTTKDAPAHTATLQGASIFELRTENDLDDVPSEIFEAVSFYDRSAKTSYENLPTPPNDVSVVRAKFREMIRNGQWTELVLRMAGEDFPNFFPAGPDNLGSAVALTGSSTSSSSSSSASALELGKTKKRMTFRQERIESQLFSRKGRTWRVRHRSNYLPDGGLEASSALEQEPPAAQGQQPEATVEEELEKWLKAHIADDARRDRFAKKLQHEERKPVQMMLASELRSGDGDSPFPKDRRVFAENLPGESRTVQTKYKDEDPVVILVQVGQSRSKSGEQVRLLSGLRSNPTTCLPYPLTAEPDKQTEYCAKYANAGPAPKGAPKGAAKGKGDKGKGKKGEDKGKGKDDKGINGDKGKFGKGKDGKGPWDFCRVRCGKK
ncbi:unnamed protein product [Amoebophrya sp. A120]|nr:unnamed protein product [Amoebophrya sp. A120]|eukprot:GSA120T00003366001.1